MNDMDMMEQLDYDNFFSAGGLVFITVALVCAFMRWNHHPCGVQQGNMNHARQVRNIVTAFFAGTALSLPYVLFPEEPSVWTYTTAFELLYYPAFITVMMKTYFRFDAGMNRHSWYMFAFVPGVCIVSLMILLAGYRKWLVWHSSTILLITEAISALLTAVMVKVVVSLKKKADRYNTENYSSDDDFPYRFLMRILYYPILWMSCVWICSITGNRWVRFATDLVTSVWMVYFLNIILEPVGDVEDGTDRDEEEEDSDSDIKAEVLALILKRFREPHLLKSEILLDVGSGKVSKASKFISSIGYYNLVNMFRLEYARQYKEAHPQAKQEEIAEEAGFASRTAYYKAKRSVGEIDRSLTKDVCLGDTCGNGE